MKPFIVCHMMASLDGRIDCDMLDHLTNSECYYDILRQYNCQAFIEGRVSRAKHTALPDAFQSTGAASCGFIVHRAQTAKEYAVSLDTRGTLMWASNQIDGQHLVCIVSENAPADYLAYLKTLGASYIAVGKDSIDLRKAVEILNSEFGIERIAVVGGGNINGAFLEAGLLDEISMLYGPIIDARRGMTAAFDGLPADTAPRIFKLGGVRQYDNGCVWMRYLPSR